MDVCHKMEILQKILRGTTGMKKLHVILNGKVKCGKVAKFWTFIKSLFVTNTAVACLVLPDTTNS